MTAERQPEWVLGPPPGGWRSEQTYWIALGGAWRMAHQRKWRADVRSLAIPGRSSATLVPYAVAVSLAGAVVTVVIVYAERGLWRTRPDPGAWLLVGGVIALALPPRLYPPTRRDDDYDLASALCAALVLLGPLTGLVVASVVLAVFTERRSERYMVWCVPRLIMARWSSVRSPGA